MKSLKQSILLVILLMSFTVSAFAEETLDPCESLARENCEKRLAAVQQKYMALKENNSIIKEATNNLQKQQAQKIATLDPEKITPLTRDQAQLKEALANANHDGASITVVEIQQLIDAITFKISSLENELRNATLAAGQSQLVKNQMQHVQHQLTYQRELLDAEKQYLDEAKRSLELSRLQLSYAKQWREEVENQYKLKQRIERQQQLLAKEVELEREQREWAKKLTELNQQLNGDLDENTIDEKAREKIQLDIIEAREQSNVLHIKIVLARLNSNLITLHENIHDNMSLNELNSALQQATSLSDETKSLQKNINAKLNVLKRRGKIGSLHHDSSLITPEQFQHIEKLVEDLIVKYQSEFEQSEQILGKIYSDQDRLQQGLSRVLARRQGLPGFDWAAWKSFGVKLFQLPNLARQAIEAIGSQFKRSFTNLHDNDWIVIVIIELIWFCSWFLIRNTLRKIVSQLSENRTSVANNMLFVLLELLRRNLEIIFIFTGFLFLMWLSESPIISLLPIIYLVLVWLVFRVAIQISRLSLLETVGSVSGNDVKLYRQLRIALFSGGGLTMLTVLAHLLPVGLEVRDFFNRLFMLFLAITGVLLLRNWRVVPEIIEAFLPRRRPYLMRVIRLLSVLIPLTLLSTGIIGIIGYVDLAWTISLYEAMFLLILSAYVFSRGLLNDLMDYLSIVAIRRLRNGWLWTQALMRPLDKILHLVLFFATIYCLFYFYGWDKESYVVQKIDWILNFPLIRFEPTIITLWSIIEFAITIAILIWAARWTREFSFRWLFAKTRDLGLRNSLSVLTQYGVVIFVFVIALRLIGIETTGLNYILTALAFGIGFGLRDLARNYVSGFVLLIERPVRTGDLVTVGEYEGEVMHIGMRAITLHTWDHMEVLVPNAEIFETTFTNWTRHDSIVRSVVAIKVNRQDDPNFIKKIITEVLSSSQNVVSDPAPQVFLKEVQEPLLEFELRYFIDLSQGYPRPEIRSQVLFEIWEAFKANGVKSPNPQQDIHVRTIASSSQSDEIIVDP